MNARIPSTFLQVLRRPPILHVVLKRPSTSSSSLIRKPITYKILIKPALFAAGFSGAAFGLAAIATYENHKRRHRDIWGYFSYKTNEMMGSHPVTLGIIATNIAVFLAWRVPRLHPILTKYFTSGIKARNMCFPMFLSCFSHMTLPHLSFNMIAFWSFAKPVISVLGAEQFVALYLSSGVIASLAGLALKVCTRSPAASVGASGGILGMVATYCTLFPNSQLSIIFLPWFPFSAGAAIKGIICLDVTGVVLRWQLFDHAAHLGGTLFGLYFVYYGNYYYMWLGDKVIRGWRKVTSR